jgi:hypothetical protein
MANTSRSKSEPQKCRNGCGMLIYFDFVNPEGKTPSGKWKPLVYYQEDVEAYSGVGHDCPKSTWNQQKAQGGQQQQTQQVAKPESQQQQNSSVRSDVWLIPKDDWDKVQSHIANITHQLERLSEYYGDLLDHVRVMSRPVDKKEEAMAEAELAYDQAKEDGTLNV